MNSLPSNKASSKVENAETLLLVQACLAFFLYFVLAYLMLMAIVLLFAFLIAIAYHSQVSVFEGLPPASPYMMGAAAVLSVGLALPAYFENKKAYEAYALPGQRLPIAQIQRKEIMLNKNANEAFSLCLDSLKTFKEGFRKINSDPQNLQITAITKKHEKSEWGEKIVFSLKPVDHGKTLIVITSQSNLILKILDLAKSLENVMQITDFLKQDDVSSQ